VIWVGEASSAPSLGGESMAWLVPNGRADLENLEKMREIKGVYAQLSLLACGDGL
jgi:hypothetical protein